MLSLPLPALALDVEAISRGLVEAGPWGKNADILPVLLVWLGLILLLAVLLKLGYSAFDAERKRRQTRAAARQLTEHWILEMGELLKVSPPRDLKPGGAAGTWHQYRRQVKQALLSELQRSRQLAALVDELQSK
jgi:hypothetical protein